MKKLLLGLTLLVSISSFASDALNERFDTFNSMLQSGEITTQDFVDLVHAYRPSSPAMRVLRWEQMVEEKMITVEDYKDLVLAQEALMQ